MTEEELQKIKEHIEIHARRESRAIKITEIMRKAVNELERITELETQIEEMKNCGNCKHQCSFLFQDEIDCLNNGLPKWEIKEK